VKLVLGDFVEKAVLLAPGIRAMFTKGDVVGEQVTDVFKRNLFFHYQAGKQARVQVIDG
jgi:hypothetical protein